MDAASSGSYVITLTASITGTANLRALNLASGMGVTLEGGGFTLSGNSLYRGLFVYAGTVTVQHLTIQDAVAQGGKGGHQRRRRRGTGRRPVRGRSGGGHGRDAGGRDVHP